MQTEVMISTSSFIDCDVAKLSEETALIIAEEIWEHKGDIRDAISLSKLVKKHDGPGEIAEIIKTFAKYGYATG